MKRNKLILGVFIAAIIEFTVISFFIYKTKCPKPLSEKTVEIYTVFHKPWKIYQNDIVIPIHAGRALNLERAKPLLNKMIGDDTGDNISLKNQRYSELTALYWIWKNSKADYVGLMHYRRYFDLSFYQQKSCQNDVLCRRGLEKENVKNLMQEYDIIVMNYSKDVTMYTYYAQWHYIENLDKLLAYLETNYPKEFAAAGKVLLKRKMRGCNIFIMKKEILDKYAQWLFPILFEIEDSLIYDGSQAQFSRCLELNEAYQQRAVAFLGERLFAFWLQAHQDEYNILDLEFPQEEI